MTEGAGCAFRSITPTDCCASLVSALNCTPKPLYITSRKRPLPSRPMESGLRRKVVGKAPTAGRRVAASKSNSPAGVIFLPSAAGSSWPETLPAKHSEKNNKPSNIFVFMSSLCGQFLQFCFHPAPRQFTAKWLIENEFRQYFIKIRFVNESTDNSRVQEIAGLCVTCINARRIESARGSVFVLCELSFKDPRFPKYPALPVLSCVGYKPGPEGATRASQ